MSRRDHRCERVGCQLVTGAVVAKQLLASPAEPNGDGSSAPAPARAASLSSMPDQQAHTEQPYTLENYCASLPFDLLTVSATTSATSGGREAV